MDTPVFLERAAAIAAAWWLLKAERTPVYTKSVSNV
jgi:hypothetical protein